MSINILCFGDSITYGEYDGVFGGWVDLLKREFLSQFHSGKNEVLVFNLGIGGETSKGILKRFSIESEARKSDEKNIVFLAFGANDLAIKEGDFLVNPGQFHQNMKTLLQLAKAFSETVFLLSILPISDQIDGVKVASEKIRTNENVKKYNQILQHIASELNVEFIDLYPLFLPQKEKWLSADGVHPNDQGYQFLAKTIKPIIEDYL